MKPYAYILIEFFTVIVCLIFSFDKRIQFHKHFTSFFKASLIVAVPFIIWDILFTEMEVWWFNFDYTLGIKLCGLPVEEWLFFICIPFSCIFTFFYIETFFKLDLLNRYTKLVSVLLIMICLFVAVCNTDKIYPLVTCITTIIVLIYLEFIVKADWVLKALVVYLILLPGFISVNGLLTGSMLDSPIVNYAPEEILNIRLFTIPVEDMLYGFTQFILVWYFFQFFKSSSVKKSSPER